MPKGQISSLDLVIAASIFIAIMLSIIGAWNDIRYRIDRYEDKRLISQKALSVAELLTKTGGDPVYWEGLGTVDSDTVNSLGLSSGDNILDEEKLVRFGTADYGEIKTILGLSREEFNLTVYNVTGGNRVLLYSFGRSYNETNSRVSRYALLDNDLVELRLVLFYNTSTYLVT